MSISNLYPAIAPSLNLSFALTKALDPRITFTRASTATYYGTETAKAEENLLLQSQDFTTSWTVAGTNATVTSNTTAAPNGTTTADTLTDDATSGVHRVAQSLTTSNTNQMVYSVFAKYSTLQFIAISLSTSTGTWAGAKFDVQNGVAGSISQQGTGFTANSSSMTAVGNGWYRCVLVLTPGASGSAVVVVSGATDNTTFTTSQRGSEVYTGTGSAVFLWGCQLEQRSAATNYTPTTTQSITNYIPVLESQASGVARFDHNPTTFDSLGLLIEESRANLILQSEEFDNAGWTKDKATIAANVIVSPDGTVDADKLIVDSGLTVGQAFQAQTLTVSTTFTFSCYAKAGEFSFVNLSTRGPENLDIGAFFNLTVGTVGTVSAGVTASMTPVGNGWYRCAVTRTTGTGATASRQRVQATNADNVFSTGDGFSGIFIWGAQLEAGAFATSYIPTVASQVTRAADVASMTGTNFSSWYNQAAGTLFADYNLGLDSISSEICMFDDGTISNTIQVRYSSASLAQYSVNVGGANQVSLAPAGYSSLGNYKRAVAYETNSFQQAINNALPNAEDTSGTLPVVSIFRIGISTGGNPINGTISKIAYYPLRVTNAQLQGLTS